jgi:lysophospholipase L1-like esterase
VTLSARDAFAFWLVGAVAGALMATSLHAIPAPSAPAPLPRAYDADRYVTKVLSLQRQADPHQPDGAVVFLGDSITQGLAAGAVAPDAVNLGIAHLTAERLAVALPEMTAVDRARVVVLMIGTNDLGRGQDPARALRLIANRIHAPLVWHAVTPRDGVAVPEVNAEIARLCAARPDCTFVDTAMGAGDFTDGVHLSHSGYAKLIASLRAALP